MTTKETFESKYVFWAFGISLTVIFGLIGWTTNNTLDSINKNIKGVAETVYELKKTVDKTLDTQNGHAIQIRLLEREIQRLEEQLLKENK